MKNLVKLNGAKALSKKEQKSINGGVSFGKCTKEQFCKFCEVGKEEDACTNANWFHCITC